MADDLRTVQDSGYCQVHILGGNRCIKQCDECKEQSRVAIGSVSCEVVNATQNEAAEQKPRRGIDLETLQQCEAATVGVAKVLPPAAVSDVRRKHEIDNVSKPMYDWNSKQIFIDFGY